MTYREYFESDPLSGTMPRDPTCPRGQISKKTGFPCSGAALPGGDDIKYSDTLYKTATGFSSAGNYDRDPSKPFNDVDYTKTDVLTKSATPNYASWLSDTSSLGHYTGENNTILPQEVHRLGNSNLLSYNTTNTNLPSSYSSGSNNSWGGGRDERIISLLMNALANQSGATGATGATGKTGCTGGTGGTGGCNSSISNWWSYGWDAINHRCSDEVFYRGTDGKIHSYCNDGNKDTIRNILNSGDYGDRHHNRWNRNERRHNYTFDTPTTNTYTDNNELPYDYNRQNTGSCDDDDEECDDC